MFRTAFLILSGNVVDTFLSLVRNLLIARLISVENYGIAATFAVALSIIEMASQIGLQQQIVQSKQGADPRFQAALQGFQLLRNCIGAAVLFLCGGLMADFMNMPEVAWAYRMLGLVPLLRGLQHFDITRMTREMRFLPGVIAQTVPSAAALAAAWPLAQWLQDYRVMLFSILLHAALGTILSQVLAERRWRVSFDRDIISGALRFGWPLLLNNLLLFAVFNGDRIIVGRELGAAVLGILSMGLTLTLTPTLVLGRSLQSFFLPQISRIEPTGETREHFRRMATLIIEIALLSGLLFAALIALIGAPVVLALLGEKYMPLLPFMGLFGLAMGVRMFKLGPVIVAFAVARTGNALIGNLPRVVTLPLAWWATVTLGDLRAVILLMLAGECAGTLLSVGMLWRQVPLRRKEIVLAGLGTLGTLIFLGVVNQYHDTLPAGLTALGCILCLGVVIALMPALRDYLFSYLRRRDRA